jgi:hypothetical protein
MGHSGGFTGYDHSAKSITIVQNTRIFFKDCQILNRDSEAKKWTYINSSTLDLYHPCVFCPHTCTFILFYISLHDDTLLLWRQNLKNRQDLGFAPIGVKFSPKITLRTLYAVNKNFRMFFGKKKYFMAVLLFRIEERIGPKIVVIRRWAVGGSGEQGRVGQWVKGRGK